MAMTSDLVTSTIAARAREPEGLRKMMLVSAIAHSIAVVGIVAGSWVFGTHGSRETIMEVSFSTGAPGVDTGGMTPLSSRQVQQVTPKTELPKPTRLTPPAAKTPEMVESTTKPAAKPAQKQASTATKTAPPSTGETVRPGQSKVETGSTSNEGGLSTGGTGASNQGQVNFCDPQYLGQMVSLIYNNWRRETNVAAKPIIRFVIQRNGTLTDITVRQSSGYYALDNAAQRAVILTRAIPPLPACYPYPDYAMNLTFEYIR